MSRSETTMTLLSMGSVRAGSRSFITIRDTISVPTPRASLVQVCWLALARLRALNTSKEGSPRQRYVAEDTAFRVPKVTQFPGRGSGTAAILNAIIVDPGTSSYTQAVSAVVSGGVIIATWKS